MSEIRETIQQVLSESQDSNIPVLFLANKQDLDKAATADALWEELQLASIGMKRAIKIMPTSGKTGKGLDDAFGWIVDTISAN